MYKDYTKKKIIELIAEDASRCATVTEVVKLKEELLADKELSVDDIVLGCLTGVLLNRNEAKRYKKLCDGYRSEVSVIPLWFDDTFFK